MGNDVQVPAPPKQEEDGAAAGGSSESVDTLSVMKSSRPHVYFRPALFYQPMLDDHVADAGLEFRINFSSGLKEARFQPPGARLAAIDDGDTTGRLEDAKRSQLALVPAQLAREDTTAVSKMLSAAATWGEPEKVAALIRTCYVTQEAAWPALLEASTRGFEEVVRVLLEAGTQPTAVAEGGGGSGGGGPTPLHRACANGHEATARALIEAMKGSDELVRAVDTDGATAFEVARRNDMRRLAERLEAYAASLSGGGGTGGDGGGEGESEAKAAPSDGAAAALDEAAASPAAAAAAAAAVAVTAAEEDEDEEEEGSTAAVSIAQQHQPAVAAAATAATAALAPAAPASLAAGAAIEGGDLD